MVRRIFAGILILLSTLLFVLSIAGIGAIWFYNEPVTREATRQLKEVDTELAQAEATLKSSEMELERALRIVDSAQAALEKLAEQSEGTESLLGNIQTTLDDRLLPELKTTRTRLQSARTTLESMHAILSGVGSFIPGVNLNAPDTLLTDLIDSARSLDTEIKNVEGLALQVSIFVSNNSFLLGGDLTQTRDSLQSFLAAIQDYEKKVAGWRAQGKQLLTGAPQWIDQASIVLTIFLVWFGISQFGLLLHGLSMRRGGDPFLVLKRERKYNPLMKNARDIELED